MKNAIFKINKILDNINDRWQNFIEDMFGMGNFSCPTYKNEKKRTAKNKSL